MTHPFPTHRSSDLEGLEAIERALLLEDLDIGLQGRRSGEDTGRAAFRLLGAAQMRRRVGADEEAAIARRHRLAQGEAMAHALGDRQAVEMRAQAALE